MASARRGYQKPGPPADDRSPLVAWTTPAQCRPRSARLAHPPVGQPSPWGGIALPDEVARARRLVDPAARARSLALRQATRAILAGTSIRPRAAPSRARRAASRRWSRRPGAALHLTDSRDLALLALAHGPRRNRRRVRACGAAPGRHRARLSQRLVAALEHAPPADRDALFFRHWTAFEPCRRDGGGARGPRRTRRLAGRTSCRRPGRWRRGARARGSGPGSYFGVPD